MFTKQTLVPLVGALAMASAQTTTSSVEYPTESQIEASAATVQPYSPVSNVKGLAFDRFTDIWFENQYYDVAAGDDHFSKLASEGILLTNFWAVTHPSEPNYCSSAGGENFGMDNDDFRTVPANVSTIADLFDTKKISWGQYQEAMPYPGYEGFRYPESGPDDYVRKHDPLILFDSITNDPVRSRQIKNFTSFNEDLKNQQLPQYMFITPNMTNDGHDTNITFSGDWLNGFLPPLLENTYFNDNSLVLVSFDEAGSDYTKPNRIYSFLVGSAIPDHLKGTKDDTFYTHYSIIASLSANWGLPALGRWDCGANLLNQIAEKVGYTNWKVDTSNLYLNETYPGPLSAGDYSTYSPVWPVPATTGKCSAGHGIAKVVQQTWGGMQPTYNYTSPVPYDSVSGTNTGITYYRIQNGKPEIRITE